MAKRALVKSFELETCMHGVTEELDYHDCDKCKEIAEDLGVLWVDKEVTRIYFKDPRKKKTKNK